MTTCLYAIRWVTSQKTGTSTLGLQCVLELGSYVTESGWQHKLRRAMMRPGRDQLSGLLETDKIHVGGSEEGLSGRQTEKIALLVQQVVSVEATAYKSMIKHLRWRKQRHQDNIWGYLKQADTTIVID